MERLDSDVRYRMGLFEDEAVTGQPMRRVSVLPMPCIALRLSRLRAEPAGVPDAGIYMELQYMENGSMHGWNRLISFRSHPWRASSGLPQDLTPTPIVQRAQAFRAIVQLRTSAPTPLSIDLETYGHDQNGRALAPARGDIRLLSVASAGATPILFRILRVLGYNGLPWAELFA